MSTDLDKDPDRVGQVGDDKTASRDEADKRWEPVTAAAYDVYTSEKDDDVEDELMGVEKFLEVERFVGEHGHGKDGDVGDGHYSEDDPDPKEMFVWVLF